MPIKPGLIREGSLEEIVQSLTFFERTSPQLYPLQSRFSYFPVSAEERLNFAYLLGVFVRGRQGPIATEVRRVVNGVVAAKRIENRYKFITRKGARVRDGVFTFQNRGLIAMLEFACSGAAGCYFVADDAERQEFLRATFDVGEHVLVDRDRGMYVQLTLGTPYEERTLRSLFELGIYPYVEKDGKTLALREIQTILELGLFSNTESRKRLTTYVAGTVKQDYSVAVYYSFRKHIQLMVESGESPSYKALQRECGVLDTTIRSWVSDIDHSLKDKHRKPLFVSRYEILCDLLGVPNVYTADKPIQRHGKWFFPVATDSYVMHLSTQETYFHLSEESPREFSDEDINFIESNLKQYLAGDKKRELDFLIGGNVITSIFFKDK